MYTSLTLIKHTKFYFLLIITFVYCILILYTMFLSYLQFLPIYIKRKPVYVSFLAINLFFFFRNDHLTVVSYVFIFPAYIFWLVGLRVRLYNCRKMLKKGESSLSRCWMSMQKLFRRSDEQGVGRDYRKTREITDVPTYPLHSPTNQTTLAI